MKTNKQKTLSGLLLLLISLSCTTYKKKKMPSEGLWEKCPRCRTYGAIKESYTKRSSKGRDKEKDDDRSCLLCPFMATDQYQNFKEKAEADQITDQNPKQLPYRPLVEIKTKYVKCNLCDGIGWIKVKEDEKSIMLKKKTEMYDFELK